MRGGDGGWVERRGEGREEDGGAVLVDGFDTRAQQQVTIRNSEHTI